MRPSIDAYFLSMAKLVATRATCARRSVGCVLVDSHNHVLATGYNGVAAGLPHCIDEPCPGAKLRLKSGTGLDLCEAIHAEQNSLLQARDVYAIKTAYVTCSPCVTCAKLLSNTGCQRIVFAERYAHDEPARAMFLARWREHADGGKGRWVHHEK